MCENRDSITTLLLCHIMCVMHLCIVCLCVYACVFVCACGCLCVCVCVWVQGVEGVVAASDGQHGEGVGDGETLPLLCPPEGEQQGAVVRPHPKYHT